jgi:hypothetical protein
MKKVNKMTIKLIIIIFSELIMIGLIIFKSPKIDHTETSNITVEIMYVDKSANRLIKLSNMLYPIYTYKSCVSYNDTKYYIDGYDTYEYCEDKIGQDVDAELTTYYFKDNTTKQKINLIY